MNSQLPATMKAIELSSYHGSLYELVKDLHVKVRPMLQPASDELIIKVEAAPCNPSDILFMQGIYKVKKPLPAIPGWEGAGTVVKSGGSLLGRLLLGRRVAFICQHPSSGTWAEYCIVKANQCFVLDAETPIAQAATLIINPLTAYALVDYAKKGRHQAIVQSAAASQLGRMIIALAEIQGIPTINIVRRKAQEELLQAEGVETVLNSEREDFLEQLQEAVRKVHATIAFDAVAGSMTGYLLNALLPASQVYVYGALSYKPCRDIDPSQLIFKNKHLHGFYLEDWVKNQSFWTLFRVGKHIQNLMRQEVIKTQVYKTVPLQGIKEVLIDYAECMTQGKIIIKPHE